MYSKCKKLVIRVVSYSNISGFNLLPFVRCIPCIHPLFLEFSFLIIVISSKLNHLLYMKYDSLNPSLNLTLKQIFLVLLLYLYSFSSIFRSFFSCSSLFYIKLTKFNYIKIWRISILQQLFDLIKIIYSLLIIKIMR